MYTKKNTILRCRHCRKATPPSVDRLVDEKWNRGYGEKSHFQLRRKTWVCVFPSIKPHVVSFEARTMMTLTNLPAHRLCVENDTTNQQTKTKHYIQSKTQDNVRSPFKQRKKRIWWSLLAVGTGGVYCRRRWEPMVSSNRVGIVSHPHWMDLIKRGLESLIWHWLIYTQKPLELLHNYGFSCEKCSTTKHFYLWFRIILESNYSTSTSLARLNGSQSNEKQYTRMMTLGDF